MFGVDRPQLMLVRFENLVDEFCAALEHLGVEESESCRRMQINYQQASWSAQSLGRFCYEFEQAPAHEPRIDIDALHRVPKLAGKAANFLEIGETVEIESLATALLVPRLIR